MEELIRARELSKSFGDQHAVVGLSLLVNAGEIYGLVGPDGAGKTTTIRLLCGALRPDSGETSIGEYSVERNTEKARSLIGYLPQRFSLYEELTVLENIRFFAETRGLTANEWRPRCMDILAFVGLAEYIDRRAGQLSGGMKQKLGLAAALVHNPRVLLLDEPTTGVDPVTRQDFWQLIIRLVSDEAVAVLVSTPYMDEAARCNRVGFLQQGKLVVEGTPSQLRSRLADRVLELRGSPLGLLRKLSKEDRDVEDAQMFGDLIHLRVVAGKAEKVISRLEKRIQAEGGQLVQLHPVAPQLEDVFISLLESQNG
jgi:ABC-2 type transport system ATP-binding protein